MEMRSVLEGKIYVLFMNPIQGRCEDCAPVAAASDYQKLVDWYNSQRCQMYEDGWMRKQFQKGSWIENFNPVNSTELGNGDYWHHGIYAEWVRLDSGGNVYNLNPSIMWLG